MLELEAFEDESKFKVGYKECLKALKEGIVKTLIIARNADQFVLRKPIELANISEIDVEYVDTKERLGKICKIDVGAAIAVIIDHSK